MDVYLALRSRSEGPALDYKMWCDWVRQRPGFVPGAPVREINPFTRKPQTFQPKNDTVTLSAGDAEAAASWSRASANEIIVNGDSTPAQQLAVEIAVALNCTVIGAND